MNVIVYDQNTKGMVLPVLDVMWLSGYNGVCKHRYKNYGIAGR